MIENITDILESWMDSQLENIHTVLPGVIEEYYGHDQRRARVRVIVKPAVGGGQRLEIKPIDDVPVVFPSSSTFNMLFPLKKNDGVLLLFSEVGIGNYLNGASVPVNADSLNRFTLADCIAIPGMWTFKNAPQPSQVSNNDLVIQYKDSHIVIKENGNVNINGSSKSFVTHTELNAALQSYNTQLAGFFTALYTLLGTPYPGATIDISSAATTTVKTGG